MTTDKERLIALVRRINETSNADFVKRLLDAKRKTLKNVDGTVSTHELGYVTEGDDAVVFPSVQSVGDSLVRFPYPESYERAVEKGDTVHMSVPDAELFTGGYKETYPGFKQYGPGGWIEKLARSAKNAARRAISKEARLAESYSSKEYTFDEAYRDARSKGQKTFFWNGDYYNTDYEGEHGRQYKRDVASGKAAAFQAAYPGYTNPELRKEKQEELDTYGITNEQTINKTWREKKLRKIDPKSYNIQTAINSLVSGFDYSKRHSTKEAEDLFVKKYGRIAKDYLDAWKQFDRRFEEEEKFLNEMKKKYPIAEKSGTSVQFFMSDEDFEEMRNKLDPLFIPPYERSEFKDIASKYDRFVGPVTDNNVFRGGSGKHRDEYDYLLGYPQIGNTIGISKYRTGTLPYYYDVGIHGSFNSELESGNHVVGDNGNYGIHQLDGVSPVLKTLLRPLIKKTKPNVELGNKHGVKFNAPLGMFTLSKPSSNEYMSVYDIFDIDPFGYGDDKSLIKIGRPFEYYSRIYPDGNEPNIDYLYDSFEFVDGGPLLRRFGEGGSIHIKPSHRGRLTELKERTGKTESELYNDGNPAHKKMVVFARNSRKWHGDGGPLDLSGIKTTNNRPYNADYISYIDTALRNGGMNDYQRASVLANIIEESGGNPFAEGPGGFYGLLQWSGERYPKTKETDVYKEIDNQIKNILATAGNSTDKMSWTHGGKGSGYNSFKDAMNAYNGDKLEDVMRGYTLGYVRPAGGVDSYNNRMKVARQLYDMKGFRTFDAGGFIRKHGKDKILSAIAKMKQSK